MSKHGNADGLLWLPIHVEGEKEVPGDLEVFNVAQVDALPVTAQQLGQATCSDLILSKYTRKHWPEMVNKCLKPYWTRTDC